MSGLFDQDARDAIRNALDENLLVEAAAGTGKTTELVARLVNVLRAGKAKVDGIVAVTFTKKAAGELKLRLRQALDQARSVSTGVERENLEDAIAHLEDARIGTIHAFCAEILRERPVEARVDPRFAELADGEALALFDRAFDRWMQDELAELPEGLRRALLRPAPPREFRTAAARLQQAAWKLIEWRDYSAKWRRDPFLRDAEIDRLLDQLATVARLSADAENTRDQLYIDTECVRALQLRIDRARETRSFDYDVLEAQLLALVPEVARGKRKGRGRYSANVPRDDLVLVRENLLADLRLFEKRTEADLAAVLQSELLTVKEAYEAAKGSAGKLDFVDLLVRARDLLKNDATVRSYFRQRFQRIFIDELQDTDPLQAEILLLLAADDPAETDWRRARPVPGKLFLVGDPKQSIYRFRRADVVLYQQVKDHLMSQGVRLVHLSHSFRANRAIQEAVNASFAPEMNGDHDTGQPSYVALTGGPPEPNDRPSVIALPIPRPNDLRGINKEEIRRSLPGAVAAFCAWMVKESGWTVRDPANKNAPAPIAPRHIAILFRNYVSFGNDVTRPYSKALESLGVQHILVAGRSFHRRDEVETMRAALAAIEHPDDELSIYATLRGPLFAIPDEVLLAHKDTHGRLHPFRKFEGETGVPGEALAILARLNQKRNMRPIAETLSDLLAITRAHAGFALRSSGDQVLANVQRVIELARGFEIGGGLSFRGFLEHLDREADSERSSEAPLLEEGAEGVRMMTVHAAKGLEFPVVILADINANLAHRDPDRYLDPSIGLYSTKILGCMPWELIEHSEAEHKRDRAEGVRLAYVAATRARDILVVPSVGLREQQSWYDPLNAAVYPANDAWRKRAPAAGCPAFFGDSSIVCEAPQVSWLEPKGVCPGEHVPRAGSHKVVWWDPRLLGSTAATRFGLRNEPLLGDKAKEVADQTLAAYYAWKDVRAASLSHGEVKSIVPFAASEMTAPAAPPGSYLIEDISLPREAGRPSGTRFGTLVHTVLRDVAYDAGSEQIRALAELHGRMIGASANEVAAAIRPVTLLLGHKLIERARASSRCHRELPIICTTDEQMLLDGSIDLCFLEDSRWIVVDFKTDFDVTQRKPQYLKQMKWYIAAVSKTFAAPARGILLSV
jgi:ATP-dependent exoDNAse (exonuclease V) beta subunit